MIRSAAALLLLVPLYTSAQTSTTHHPGTTHRSPGASARSAGKTAAPTAAQAAADNPPGVPSAIGTPKPLYALRYTDLIVGTGPLAPPQKWYTVRYTGWLTDGTKFDSSYDHPGQDPISFPVGAHQVIAGWDTGFDGMRVGGKRRLYIPYQLAYGEAGRDPIPPRSALIFDIELVSFSDTKPVPPAPTTTTETQQNPGQPQQNPSATPTPDAPTAQPSANPK